MSLHFVACELAANGQRVCAPVSDGAAVGYVVGFAVFCLVAGAGLAWGLVKLHRWNRVRHIEVDPETHHGETHYVRPIGNTVTYKDASAPTGKRTVILKNGARIFLDGKSTFITHRRLGHNYAPPPDALTVGADPTLMYLGIDDPAAYAHAVATNDAQDSLRAQVKEDKWEKVAPYILAGVAIIVVGLGVVLYYVVGLASEKVGGG